MHVCASGCFYCQLRCEDLNVALRIVNAVAEVDAETQRARERWFGTTACSDFDAMLSRAAEVLHEFVPKDGRLRPGRILKGRYFRVRLPDMDDVLA